MSIIKWMSLILIYLFIILAFVASLVFVCVNTAAIFTFGLAQANENAILIVAASKASTDFALKLRELRLARA